MGRSLAQFCLDSNDLVVVVGQTSKDSLASMQNWHTNALGTLCDIRCSASVERVITLAYSHFKRINVIVNCSEYGVIGACEDQDEHELRDQFETNFMGTLHIIQASLPHLRKQKSGRYHIYNTIPGSLGIPGLGPFYATKNAIEGLLETMLYEVNQFDIKVTLIECGWIHRDMLKCDTKVSPTVTSVWGDFIIKSPSEPYSQLNSPALHTARMIQWLGDKKPTSIIKCADLGWQLGHCSYPPSRLYLGSYAIESARDRMRSLVEELEDWTHLHFPITGESLSSEDSEERREREDSAEKP